MLPVSIKLEPVDKLDPKTEKPELDIKTDKNISDLKIDKNITEKGVDEKSEDSTEKELYTTEDIEKYDKTKDTKTDKECDRKTDDEKCYTKTDDENRDLEVEVPVEVDSQKSPEHSLSLETVAYADVHRVDDSKEVESEVSTTGYSRKSSVGDDIIPENQEEEEVSDLVSQAIQGAVKLTRKRDKSVSLKLTKRAKFGIDSEVEKYVALTDLNKMEQYISLA